MYGQSCLINCLVSDCEDCTDNVNTCKKCRQFGYAQQGNKCVPLCGDGFIVSNE